jgi:hypothetical protein
VAGLKKPLEMYSIADEVKVTERLVSKSGREKYGIKARG